MTPSLTTRDNLPGCERRTTNTQGIDSLVPTFLSLLFCPPSLPLPPSDWVFAGLGRCPLFKCKRSLDSCPLSSALIIVVLGAFLHALPLRPFHDRPWHLSLIFGDTLVRGVFFLIYLTNVLSALVVGCLPPSLSFACLSPLQLVPRPTFAYIIVSHSSLEFDPLA